VNFSVNHPIRAHMGTMLAIQAATRKAREATGLFIGVRVCNGQFRVGTVTMVKNREVFDPMSNYATLDATLDTLRKITEDAGSND